MIKNTDLSDDGYIYDQNRLDYIPYGNYMSDYNGCGWIAIYNVLNRLKVFFTVEHILNYLNEKLPFGGFLGTPLCLILKYLKTIGFVTKIHLSKSVVKERLSESQNYVAICYEIGLKMCHYFVMYKSFSKNGYQIWNNGDSRYPTIRTFENCLNKRTVLRLYILIEGSDVVWQNKTSPSLIVKSPKKYQRFSTT